MNRRRRRKIRRGMAGVGIVLVGLMLGMCGCGVSRESGEPESSPADSEEVTVKEHKSGAWTPGLSAGEKETVFEIAEATLNWCVGGSIDRWSFEKYDITEKLKKETHSFVTLKINGQLRGCIGSLPPYPALPMHESVHQNARSSAQRDPRFRPVSERELGSINIHVSLLSDSSPIANLDEFKIGEHGIILTKGRARAVFLPEVAIEQGWTKEDTAEHLCEKAGLPRGAWREGASFEVFSSVVLARE